MERCFTLCQHQLPESFTSTQKEIFGLCHTRIAAVLKYLKLKECIFNVCQLCLIKLVVKPIHDIKLKLTLHQKQPRQVKKNKNKNAMAKIE